MSWVNEWVKENGDNDAAVELLRSKLDDGAFGAGRAPAVRAYLARVDAARAEALTVRAVNAAEIQADAAREAVQRSNIAIVISIVAALVAVADLLTRLALR